MGFSSLSELVKIIYDEIKNRNTALVGDVVPVSTQFFPFLAKKFHLNPEKIQCIVDILSNAKFIISFPVADSGDAAKPVNGFIVTKGDVISAARKRNGEYFERLYTDEFSKKVPVEKLIVEFTSKREKFNNTPLGIAANITMMLAHYQSMVERNIMQYSDKNKDKIFEEEMGKAAPLEDFLARDTHAPAPKESAVKKPTQAKNDSCGKAVDETKRRAMDLPQYDEFKAYMLNNSIEKTIKLYGVEFYTRVCFREYQFALMRKLISEGHIKKESDLRTVKLLLDKERMTADKDHQLNTYAQEINALMKCINDLLKELQ
jgi:hypothetical protein